VLTNEQQMAILSRISTSRMLALAADLWNLDRRVGGQGLEQACERTAVHLRAAGADQVELKTFPYGAEHRYLSWRHERRPFTEEAELWLVTPEGGETLVCRTSDDPACTMGALRSTPPEGEVLEVVDVGFGTRPSDYRSHRMPGKLALASGHHFQAAMLEALVQRQAEGLLCGPGSEVSDPMCVVPNRLGDPSLFTPHRPFGFNLSSLQFNRLVNVLAAGAPVKAKVKVRVTLDTGTLPVVRAQLEGGELKEQCVLLVADIEPDEAPLGVACLHEIMQAIGALIAQGTLPPLRRTLQVLLAPGALGTIAWLSENQEHLAGIRAALHLTVPSPEASTRVQLEPPPPGMPSFVPDLLRDHLRWASTVRGSYRGDIPMEVRSGLSAPESALAPLSEIGVSGVAIACTGQPGAKQIAAPVYHGPLHRLTAALACAAVDLCNLDHDDLPRLISSSYLKGHQRLNQRAEGLHDRIQAELHHEQRSSRTGRHLLWLVESSMEEGLRRESLVLKSCGDYLDGPGPLALGLADSTSQLKQLQLSLIRSLGMKISGALGPRARLSLRRNRLSALERRASSVVPRRQFTGPLPASALMREAGETDRLWLAHHSGVLASQPVGNVLLQWIDSERTLLEIFDLICLDYPEADLKLLWRYLDVLQGAGLVALKQEKKVSVPGESHH
jgi:hypothetical protein